MIDKIEVVNNFLSKEEIDVLMKECLDENTQWRYRDTLVKVHVANSNSHDTIKSIKSRIDSFFNNQFYVQIIRHLNKTTKETTWHRHYDAESGNGTEYGVILYLNDNFDGGELVYTNLNYTYTPKAGDMVVHPASEKFTHEVNPIISGERYTLTTFIRKA